MLRDFPIASIAKLKCCKQPSRKIQRRWPSQGLSPQGGVSSAERATKHREPGSTWEKAYTTARKGKAGCETISTSIIRI